jgi:hypothetical protein
VNPEIGYVGIGAPGCRVRLYSVWTWLAPRIDHCGNGVETQCQLLVDRAAWVDQDMTRVAVDAGESDERNGDAGLFGDFTDNGVADGFADLDPASGNSQLPSSIRRTSKSSPALLRTAANAAGRTSRALGAFASR